MGRFRIQLLLEDNTWSTRYNIPKNDKYSDTSTQWTKLSINVTDEKYGIKLYYDKIDSAHAEMGFSKNTITHSLYQLIYENYSKDLLESLPDYRKIVLLKFLFSKRCWVIKGMWIF